MNQRERYTAEWLEANCDIEVPFERAVKVELRRLLTISTELERVLRLARANLAVNLKELIDSHRDPITGGIDEREALLIIESEQDLISQIDEVLEKAGWAA